MHQVQAVETAPGKVVVSAGQHSLCRKLILLDVNWLYEKERSCDFSEGLACWSAFRYYKGIVGHCCYNRQEVPLLVSHPDDPQRRVMRIGDTPNDSLEMMQMERGGISLPHETEKLACASDCMKHPSPSGSS